jgi:hypothetical protein
MGEDSAPRLPAPEGMVNRLIAAIKPRDPGGALVVALVCGAWPFVVSCYGYGSYLRCVWLFVMWLAPPVVLLILSCRDLLRRLYLLARGKPSGPQEPLWRRPGRLMVLLVSWLSFFAGWGAGRLCRDAYCRRTRARCEPVLAALEMYKSEHGAYPESLAAISDIKGLRSEAGIDIREGRVLELGIDTGLMDEADAVIYLDRDGYSCIVPIERKMLMSFTRFYIYIRDSGDAVWRRDHIVWSWYAREE